MALFTDFRHALRALGRDRGYTTVALLTLAFGIAVNTIIFSIVNSVLLRPLAYRDPGRLVVINEIVREVQQTYPILPVMGIHYLDWREKLTSFTGMGAIEVEQFSLTRAGQPAQLHGAAISASVLPLLGVQPQLGRNFTAEDDQPGHEHVVIISDALWRSRFHADPALLGRTLMLDGTPHTVLGVLPPSFRFPKGAGSGMMGTFPGRGDVFRPIALRRNDDGGFNYTVIARLRPGVSEAAALAELNVLQVDIAKHMPEKMHLAAAITPLSEELTGGVRTGLLMLFGAVGAVLLIVCVNLANLALARATGHGRELAIRSALGASRGSLVRYILAESLCLGLAGGAAGIAIAWAGLRAVLASAPFDLPRLEEIHVDARALLFALGASLASGILFGILPALRASASDPQQALRAGSHTTTEGRHGLLTRDLLVGFEAALSAVLLIVAGLLIGSFTRLLSVDKGFNADRLITAEINLPTASYHDDKDRAAYYDKLNAALENMPGVTQAGLISQLPLQGETWVNLIRREGDKRPQFELPPINMRFSSPHYFETMGIPLVAGSTFTGADRGRKVAIISERVAREVWPGENALGKRFDDGEGNKSLITVVGVVRDVRVGLDKKPVFTMYVPYWQQNQPHMYAVLRTAMDPRGIAPALRAAVSSVDPDTVIGEMKTMQNVVSESVAQQRFQMRLIAGFAASALLLACLGIYGVVAWSVARRKNEIGLRMALGAGASGVERMVVAHALRPVLAGLLAGIIAALALGRVLTSLLFGVSAHDPLTIIAVTVVLAVVAAVACWLPAHRATRADPLKALRYE